DKFKVFNLQTKKAKTVKPPLLSGVLINAECKLIEDGVFNRYNAAVLQITKAWHRPDMTDQRLMHHNGNGIFTLAGEKVDMKELMTLWHGHVENR
ncbi:MAG: flavin reductase, partial [Azoarcus sp.]|nr:flavin reductase [Azoarcus sp.]